MGEHRERVDKRMSAEINRRVIVPLILDLGGRYLVDPYLVSYDDDVKNIHWGLGYKKHGDKRHRSSVRYQGVTYLDGGTHEAPSREIITDRKIAWVKKHDNRLVQNDETYGDKQMSYDESFNRLRSLTSFDLLNRFSASAQGAVAGIGGSISSTTEQRLHTEVETDQFNKKKRERVIDTSAHLAYPGPVYRLDKDENGVVVGRTLVEEGPIWLIRCPVETIETITPTTMWGTWSASIEINVEDWAGNYGIMPGGEHRNILRFASIEELISFMKRDLVLQYKWLPKLRLSSQSRAGLAWLQAEKYRRVGPVEWEQVERNSNVTALEPSIVTPD